MCQQWLSIIGLTAEIIGFLLIASEWRDTFQHLVLSRQNAVEKDYELTIQGEEAAKDHGLADASMWRNTQRENRLDNARRAKVFGTGVALVSYRLSFPSRRKPAVRHFVLSLQQLFIGMPQQEGPGARS